MPSGKYLMEDFYYAGGLPAVLRELGENNSCSATRSRSTARRSGRTTRTRRAGIGTSSTASSRPSKKTPGIAVLRGNLCPAGAIIKPSAATPKLMTHRARAVVFEDIEDFHRRIDDPKLDIDENCVMVLKNCGPRATPGWPRSATCRCLPSC